jgi:integrase
VVVFKGRNTIMTEQNKSQGRRRRGHGEGSIYHRADGRWVASISLGGLKRKDFYAKTRREAQELLQAALQEQKQGLLIAGPQQPLKQYLTHWLEEVHKASIRPRSYERYESMIRLHLAPSLGHISLQKLSPQQVQHLLSQKLAEGLSPTTVVNLHHLLHKALDDSVRWGLVARIFCDLVSAPRKIRYEIQPLTPEQVRMLLAAGKRHRLEALFFLAQPSSIRKGELLGLKWQDLNDAESTLQARSSLSRIREQHGPGPRRSRVKDIQSRRSFLLPPFVLEALQQRHLQQQEIRAKAARSGMTWICCFAPRQG